ncbi:unnamed protein product [Orchesella dallaii]|uniref:C2H2-type domain-containing protein n=1 Tax=Orchesella dallaii TaxID=48710 RepID=A0ABP1Q7S2_9HEXA
MKQRRRNGPSTLTLKTEEMGVSRNGVGERVSPDSNGGGTYCRAMSDAWNNCTRSSSTLSYPQQTTCLFCPSFVTLSEEGDRDEVKSLMKNLCHHMQLSSTELPEECTNPEFPFCQNCMHSVLELWKQQLILEKTWMKIGDVVSDIERTVADGEIMGSGKERAGSSSMAQVEQRKYTRLRDMILEGYRAKLYIKQRRQNSLAENTSRSRVEAEIEIPPPPEEFLGTMSDDNSTVTVKHEAEVMESAQSLNVPFRRKTLHPHGRQGRGKAVHSSMESYGGQVQHQQSGARMAGLNEDNFSLFGGDQPELAHYSDGNGSTRVSSIQNGDHEADSDNEELGNSSCGPIKQEFVNSMYANDQDEDYESMDDDSSDIFELTKRKRRVLYEGVEMIKANGTGARRHLEYLQCSVCNFTVRLPKSSNKSSATQAYTQLKTHILHVHIKKPGLPEPNRVPNLECIPCAIKFDNLKELREHKKTHSLEEPLKCPICSRPVLGSQNNLLVHMFSHKNKEEREAAVAAKERGAYASRKYKKKNEVTPRRNKKCVKNEPVRVKIGRIGKQRKIKSVGASKKKQFVCHVCCRAFKKNCAMMSHMRIHQNDRNQESSTCSQSPRRSKRQSLRKPVFVQTEVSRGDISSETNAGQRYLAEVDDGTRVVVKQETLNMLFQHL